MTEHLHRLIYYSRNRVIAGELPEAIKAILATSQNNNQKRGVTGALMFNAGCFGQVLEGEREHLETVFQSIQHDPRHTDVSLLAFESMPARMFPNWSMGFVGARPDDQAHFGDIGTSSGFDPSRASGDKLIRALRRLAISDEEAHG